jgi:hypothetical protein
VCREYGLIWGLHLTPEGDGGGGGKRSDGSSGGRDAAVMEEGDVT